MSQSNKSLSERLLRYSAIASLTASSAVLMSPTPVNADIIDVNCSMNAGGDICAIDFDDPTKSSPEFTISYYTNTSGDSGLFLTAKFNTFDEDKGLSVIGSTGFGNYTYPYVLPFNDNISASRTWQPVNVWATMYFRYATGATYGNWIPTQGTTGGDGASGAYVGVKFNLDGSGPYYGWIEIYFDGTTAVVKRIGYNTAGDPIPAAVQLSETSATTGMRGVIAAGLAGLSGALLWLRRKFGRA